jgi:hypothetical protein
MALANGVFEAEPEFVWAEVYSFNRPDITQEDVVKILDEFERVGLLRRWVEVNGIHQALNGSHSEGKVWGYWIGIEKPGRLPGLSRQGKNERVGPTPPLSVDSIKQPQTSIEQPLRTDLSLGSGFGSGSGIGLGKGSGVSEQSFSIEAIVQHVMFETGVAGNKLRSLLQEIVRREIQVVGVDPKILSETLIVAISTYEGMTFQYKKSLETFLSTGMWRKQVSEWAENSKEETLSERNDRAYREMERRTQETKPSIL